MWPCCRVLPTPWMSHWGRLVMLGGQRVSPVIRGTVSLSNLPLCPGTEDIAYQACSLESCTVRSLGSVTVTHPFIVGDAVKWVRDMLDAGDVLSGFGDVEGAASFYSRGLVCLRQELALLSGSGESLVEDGRRVTGNLGCATVSTYAVETCDSALISVTESLSLDPPSWVDYFRDRLRRMQCG